MAAKILVVDDTKSILDAVTILLTSQGYDILQASNTINAMRYIKKYKVDVAIIDVMLGEDKTGFDLFYEIIEYDNRVKVIFLTALDSDCFKKFQLHSKGAYDYLTKPFDNKELLHAVERAVKEVKFNNLIIVGYGDIAYAQSPVNLQTVLGSCVAVVLYDPLIKLGGMTHIMLPKGTHSLDTKGANEAVNTLLKKMTNLGAVRTRLNCEIYGGSNIYNSEINIGKRNIDAAKEALHRHEIKVSKEDTGGSISRQIILDTSNGRVVMVKLSPIFPNKSKEP